MAVPRVVLDIRSVQDRLDYLPFGVPDVVLGVVRQHLAQGP
ncbi:hypothetical protein [Streptomyces sp. NPDC001530]